MTRDDVRALGRPEAMAIYRARYWDAVHADALPGGLDYCTFDAAVHSGPRRAAQWLQRAVGAAADGIVGPLTLAAAQAAPAGEAVRGMCRERRSFLRALATWPTFGRGWTRRVDEVERAALAMSAAEQAGAGWPSGEGREMDGTKHWYQSRSIWGAVVAMGALAAGAFGIAIGEEERSALTDIAVQLVAGLGALVALIGRIAARRAIAR